MRRQERKETSEKFNCRYKPTSCKSTDKIAESTVVYIALVGRLIRREITARRRRAARYFGPEMPVSGKRQRGATTGNS